MLLRLVLPLSFQIGAGHCDGEGSIGRKYSVGKKKYRVERRKKYREEKNTGQKKEI